MWRFCSRCLVEAGDWERGRGIVDGCVVTFQFCYERGLGGGGMGGPGGGDGDGGDGGGVAAALLDGRKCEERQLDKQTDMISLLPDGV